MKVFFLRHGQADWPDWAGPDDDRPLTAKGKKQMKRVAKFLRAAKAQPARIISSPLPRAFQTAEIVAKLFGLQVEENGALGQGFRLHKMRRLLDEQSADDVMLVGHEPDMSTVVNHLTGAHIQLAKAGAACVEMESPRARGSLLWLVPPKLAALLD